MKARVVVKKVGATPVRPGSQREKVMEEIRNVLRAAGGEARSVPALWQVRAIRTHGNVRENLYHVLQLMAMSGELETSKRPPRQPGEKRTALIGYRLAGAHERSVPLNGQDVIAARPAPSAGAVMITVYLDGKRSATYSSRDARAIYRQLSEVFAEE
jgi:hypothetical protein